MLVLGPAAQDGVPFAHGGLFPQTWWGSLKEKEMEPAFNISTQGWKLKQDMNFRRSGKLCKVILGTGKGKVKGQWPQRWESVQKTRPDSHSQGWVPRNAV